MLVLWSEVNSGISGLLKASVWSSALILDTR